MKSFFVFILVVAICSPTLCLANSDEGYMEGHPNYNPNYYTPDYKSSPSTPNHDPNYYDRTYNQTREQHNQGDSTPDGNDIRDYNPYYDRDGNLKQ